MAQTFPFCEQRPIAPHTAAPQQHRVLPFQPELIPQTGGDGVHLGGLAHDEQQADFAAPEQAIVVAQVFAQRSYD